MPYMHQSKLSCKYVPEGVNFPQLFISHISSARSVGKHSFNVNLRMIATTSDIADKSERMAIFHL